MRNECLSVYVASGKRVEGSTQAAEAQAYKEGWEVVGGLSGVVRQLKEMVLLPLVYPEVFKAMQLTPPRCLSQHFID